ncbi:hypothetical protein J6590_070558 [Homalodisca vitripennis]|nr:hypothetical protein J6590_070558 [Homalodisca vitripennis]
MKKYFATNWYHIIVHVLTRSEAGAYTMVSMSSTLVETVSINYEDFNESFLTCGTCLCKLLLIEDTPILYRICNNVVIQQCNKMLSRP